MKRTFSTRLLLGTTLFLTAALRESPAWATATYSTNNTITSPPGGDPSYPAYSPSPGLVPLSVANQYVDVSGATPSSSISVTWSMTDIATTSNGSKRSPQAQIADDYGSMAVLADSAGHFRRYVNNGNGGVSATIQVPGGSTGIFDSNSTIKDASGNNYTLLNSASFTVANAM